MVSAICKAVFMICDLVGRNPFVNQVVGVKTTLSKYIAKWNKKVAIPS